MTSHEHSDANNALALKEQELRASFEVLQKEKEEKAALLRDLLADEKHPRECEEQIKHMKQLMNEDRFKTHQQDLEKGYCEDYLIEEVRKKPEMINKLKNPSEEVKLAAVQQF